MSQVYVIMGVSGSGKSTVGQALAAAKAAPFYDGDDFHPPENVAKMASGSPLNDMDRAPWLARLGAILADHLARGETAVMACSALKRAYRDVLRGGSNRVVFVYLQGDFDTLWRRMTLRPDHFMKPEMLRSQFATLEEPTPHEALCLDVSLDVQSLIQAILSA